jgi:hypothetical protein
VVVRRSRWKVPRFAEWIAFSMTLPWVSPGNVGRMQQFLESPIIFSEGRFDKEFVKWPLVSHFPIASGYSPAS